MALDALRPACGQYRTLQTRRLRAGLAGIFAALVAASPLHALSCVPYGLDNAIYEVATSEDGYVAAVGTLTFNERKLPKVDMSRQDDTPPITLIPARLKGTALNKKGFTQPFSTRLDLAIKCYGPWCSSAQSGTEALVFLQKTDTGYTLNTNPCGGHIFANPSKADLKQVEQCYLQGNCPKPELR